jgi:hypothetical protein
MALNLGNLDSSNGVRLDGVDAFDNGGVPGTGNVNGDGIEDLIIGAAGADPSWQDRAGENASNQAVWRADQQPPYKRGASHGHQVGYA